MLISPVTIHFYIVYSNLSPPLATAYLCGAKLVIYANIHPTSSLPTVVKSQLFFTAFYNVCVNNSPP